MKKLKKKKLQLEIDILELKRQFLTKKVLEETKSILVQGVEEIAPERSILIQGVAEIAPEKTKSIELSALGFYVASGVQILVIFTLGILLMRAN